MGMQTQAGAAQGGSALMMLTKRVIGLAAAYKMLMLSLRQWREAMSKAAEEEKIRLQFEVLLGSAKKAQERFEYLAEFAAVTPFQLPGIAKSSRILEVLTRGALSAGKGLRMVGDVAAVTDESFEDLAMHVGRVYTGLMKGSRAGRSLRRLQMIGVLPVEVRNQLEKAQRARKKGVEVWRIAERELQRYGGGMRKLALTWSGLWTTIRDNIDFVRREFAKPIQTSWKPALIAIIKGLRDMRDNAKAIGMWFARGFQVLGAIVSTIRAMSAEVSLGEVLGAAILVGIKLAGKGLGMLVVGFGKAIGFVFKKLISKEFWIRMVDRFTGIHMVLMGAAYQFSANMVEAASSFLDPMFAGIKFIREKLVAGVKIAAQTIYAGLMRAVDAFIAGIQKIPGVEKILGVTGQDTLKFTREDLGKRIAEAEGKIADQLLIIAKTWAETLRQQKNITKDEVAFTRKFGEDIEEAGRNMLSAAGIDLFSDEDIMGVFERALAPLRKLREDMKKRIPLPEEKLLAKSVGDSLSAIGGGGGFFGGTTSVLQQQLDEAKKQTTTLNDMNGKMKTNNTWVVEVIT